MKNNPEFKIKIKHPIIIKKLKYNGMIHFSIEKPNFDFTDFTYPSIWIKEYK